jgi:hypothetical protein
MINFTITFHGLQDQLLSTVVTHEVPHLEDERCQLLESISRDAVTLEELEEKTLTLLQKAQGESSYSVLPGPCRWAQGQLEGRLPEVFQIWCPNARVPLPPHD